MAKAPKKFDNMDEPLFPLDPVHDRPTHQLDPAKIELNDVMRMISYVKVKEVHPAGEHLLVEDLLKGGEFTVDGSDMIRELESTGYVAETLRINKTQMAMILVSTRGVPFTVVFKKKDGEIRTLRGYFLSHEVMFGKSLCIDLDLHHAYNKVVNKVMAAGKSEQEAAVDAKKETGGYHRWVIHDQLISLLVGGVQYKLS